MADSSEATVQATAATLAALEAGHRAWFWFCPQVEDSHPPLLLQPLSEDPSMARLRALAAQVPFPPEGTLCMGTATVGVDGTMSFGSPLASATDLSALAGWVRGNVSAHPQLARLHSARFVTVSPAGVVEATHQNQALWDGVPRPIVSGTIGETALILEVLTPSEDAWFWLTAAGPGGQPFLALQPIADDPDGSAFAARIALICRRRSGAGAVIRGVARKTEGGAFLLTTQGDSTGWGEMLQALLATHRSDWPALAALDDARLITIRGGKFADIVGASAGPDLSAQAALLDGLAEGDRAWFWFTDRSSDGGPLLLLGADREALKATARAARGEGSTLAGRLRMTRRGWIELRAKSAYPQLVPMLAAWTAAHRRRWPVLARLRGARFVVTDADGEIVSRHKDDAAWAAPA